MIKKLAIALGVLAVLSLVAATWIRSWLTPEYLRKQVETRVPEYWAGQFRLGQIGYAFPLSVSLDELVLADPSGKDEYLNVAHASASLEPWALLSGEAHVTSFLLEKPQVLLALDAQNQPEMMKHVKGEASESEEGSAAVALAVSELRIQGARFALRQAGQPAQVVEPIDARLALLGETLTLHELTLTAMEEVQLEARGKLVKLLSAPAFEGFRVEVDAGMPPGFLDPKVHGKVAGRAKATVTLEGPVMAPGGPIRLDSQEMSWTGTAPGAEPMTVAGLEVLGKLEGRSLVLESASALALGSVKLALKGGKLALLESGPALQDLKVEVDAGMPAGFLDPQAHGAVEGRVAVATTLSGPPADLKGPLTISSAGLTWKPGDAALRPIQTGKIRGDGRVEKLGLSLSKLVVALWGGEARASGRLGADKVALDVVLAQVKAGEWVGPMLLERGLGEPLPQLVVDASKVAITPSQVQAGGVKLQAKGLVVSGDVGLKQKGEGFAFTADSALEGTFEGTDLASALALPDLYLEGPLGVKMTLAQEVLAPTIQGSVRAERMKIRRPKVFSLEVRDLTGNFTFDDSKLDVPSLKANLLSGSVTAKAHADLGKVPPTYGFDLIGAKLRVPEIFRTLQLVSPFAQGELDLSFAMEGAGTDPNTLKGEGKAAIRTAKLAPNQALTALASKFQRPELAEPELDGKFKIIEVSDGKVRLGDFAGDNGKLGPITGEGNVGFDGSLGGKVTWRELPLEGEGVPALLRGKKIPLSLQLGGTLSAPEAKLGDLDKALEDLAKEEGKRALAAKAQEKLGGKLSGLVGGLLGGKQEAAPAPTTPATTGAAAAPPPTPAPKEALEEAGKNLLKGLFR